MHSYYYVPSAGGFYHTSVHGSAIPADAVAVADEEHAALMAAQAAGKIIQSSADGRPEAVEPPSPPPPMIADVKAEAARRLAPTDWMVTRQAEGGKPIPAAITSFRAAVRAASDRLAAMEPIPADYADDRHWPRQGTD